MNRALPLLVVAILAIAVAITLLDQKSPPAAEPDAPLGEPLAPDTGAFRLHALANERADYVISVGVPPAAPDRWVRVKGIVNSTVTTFDGKHYSLNEITHYFVTYPNGQLVDSATTRLNLPDGVTGLDESAYQETELLTEADLAAGEKYITMAYGPSKSRPNDAGHYATSLENISTQKIRVLRFGGYSPVSGGWELTNVTGKFYSSEEFMNWYGLGNSEWIRPGQTVADGNNYGSRPVVWAYHCESEDGTKFIVGKVLK